MKDYRKYFGELSTIQKGIGTILVASCRIDEISLISKDDQKPELVVSRNGFTCRFLHDGIVCVGDSIKTIHQESWTNIVAELIAPTFDTSPFATEAAAHTCGS